MALHHATRPGVSRPLAAALWMAVSSALWAVAEVIVVVLARGQSIPMIVMVRYITHLAALLLIVAPRSGFGLVRTRRPALQIARGLLMLAMPLCSLLVGGGVAFSAVWAVFWIAPALVAGFGQLLLAERAGWRLWAAAALGVAGATLVIHPQPGDLLAAAVPGLGMALCYSLYVVLTRMLRDEPTSTNLFYTAAAVLAPLSLGAPLFWRTPAPAELPALVAVGLVGLVALFALDKACESAPPASLTPFMCLQPLVVVALTLPISGARPGRSMLAGAMLIVGAALVSWQAPARPMPAGGAESV